MVHRVACRAIDDGRVGDVLTVVDEDSPEVDEDEQGDIGDFLERKEERIDVVREGLREAVEGVKGVRGKGRGHDPLVMRFVEALVNRGVVEGAVNPVNAEVGKEDEERVLEVIVLGEGGGRRGIIELGVAAHFGEEEGCG